MTAAAHGLLDEGAAFSASLVKASAGLTDRSPAATSAACEQGPSPARVEAFAPAVRSATTCRPPPLDAAGTTSTKRTPQGPAARYPYRGERRMSENESAVTEVGTFEVFFDEVEFDATEDVLRYTKSTRLRFGGGRISPELLGLTLALPSGRRSAIDRYRVTIERLPHEVKP